MTGLRIDYFRKVRSKPEEEKIDPSLYLVERQIENITLFFIHKSQMIKSFAAIFVNLFLLFYPLLIFLNPFNSFFCFFACITNLYRVGISGKFCHML